MLLDKKFRACLLTFILFTSLLSVLTIAPQTLGTESLGETTLYFHSGYHGEGDIFYKTVDENTPARNNYSSWPPELKIKNSEEIIEWLTIWSTYILLDGELGGLESLFDELGLGGPLTISGYYEYGGDDSVEIKGDVSFDLYFSSKLPSKLLEAYQDSVKVSISADSGFKIKEATTNIKPNLLGGKIQSYTIELENFEYSLDPGDSLIFSVEIIPSDKVIGGYIAENIDEEILIQQLENLTELLTDNDTLIETIEQVLDPLMLKLIGLEFSFSDIVDFLEYGTYFLANASEIYNITEELENIINIFLSSSFIYDSEQYPSSVTLPIDIAGEDENKKTYYLYPDSTMSEEKPIEIEEKSEIILSKESGQWDGPNFERSKILKEVSANLYINHLNLRRLLNRGDIEILIELFDGETLIDSTKENFGKNTLLDALLNSFETIEVTFDNLDNYEVTYGSHLSLKVSIANETKLGLFGLGLYQNAKLFYGSKDYPSSLSLLFDDTDHIKIKNLETDPLDGKIVPGGNVIYTLNVASDYNDQIEIIAYMFSEEEQDNWQILSPGKISISGGSQETIELVVESTKNDLDAYGDVLDLTFALSGKTGRDVFDIFVEISEDAIEYDIEVTAPPGMNIKHGRNDTYLFKIKNKNTGLWSDNYEIEVISENNFSLDVEYVKEELDVREELEIEITVHIPKYTDISSDMLTFTVISEESVAHDKDESVTIYLNTTIDTPNILEKIYQSFESAAESLGLNDLFGDYAPHLLAAIIFILIFFILIFLVFIIKRKFVEIICLDRIKEVNPDEEAKFEITIKNPHNHILNYEICAKETSPSPGWEISLDSKIMVIEPKKEHKVTLIVRPTDFAKSDDWMEVKIAAKAIEKNKSAEISTVTNLKDAKPDVRIMGVLHRPLIFKKGDIVKTSFKLRNEGNASTGNITVILYVNGEEKNKVEDIIIPRGGYADIEMPWVASKGKNNVEIIVK
ncbi:MAG: hypothetical protein JSW62_00525 [Thermoplasmatales archaeon]|nr:MAG: hypothetical protein JSW62_00525 [Thermoplasmatales archaeon]